ncbi:YibE/F family protein [Pseudoflavonifractor sp. SW1122]|uniref:YibE/F family protein n=1 Tax=Pseudoflavonifractor sp. SW1122 TaxID=2530044 RepID=UPI00143AB36C|nr:YibE/F family protein [Pseudoflavonifractor sp. SW1122]NJE74889.1 YibE/F family protein [Pseudoflavonifractor sp. SW1122]
MQIIHNPRFGQRILAIFVCLVTAVLAFMPSVSVSFQSLVSDTVSYIPGTVLEVVEEDLTPSDLKGGPQLGEQTLTIELKDGSQITLTNYLTNTHNILAREGMRVVVCVDAPENVEPYYTLYQYDRSVGLGVAVAIFLLLMLLVGGEKGFYATLALAFSLVFLLKITVPVIYSGGSPILAGLAMVLVSTAVTVFLIYGLSPRGVLGIGVVLAGEFVACGLFLLFSLLLHLSGFKSSDAENLLVAAQNTGLNISTVLFAATMIASLGAVMDVAVSLLSALWEVRLADPDITGRGLWRAGLRMGGDMIGTMSNTLIFAFAGGSLTTLLVLMTYGTDPVQLLHSDYIALELAHGLCGTCAVILTVPLASLVSAAVYPKWRTPELSQVSQ